MYGRRQNKLPVSVSYSAVKTLRNGSFRRRSMFTVRAWDFFLIAYTASNLRKNA